MIVYGCLKKREPLSWTIDHKPPGSFTFKLHYQKTPFTCPPSLTGPMTLHEVFIQTFRTQQFLPSPAIPKSWSVINKYTMGSYLAGEIYKTMQWGKCHIFVSIHPPPQTFHTLSLLSLRYHGSRRSRNLLNY